MLPDLLGIGEAIVERMLGREKRNDPITRDILTQIVHEVPQVVFFLRADSAVGEKDLDVQPCQAADRMVHVNPRIHAFDRSQLCSGRPQLRRNHVAVAAKSVEKRTAHYWMDVGPMPDVGVKPTVFITKSNVNC